MKEVQNILKTTPEDCFGESGPSNFENILREILSEECREKLPRNLYENR